MILLKIFTLISSSISHPLPLTQQTIVVSWYEYGSITANGEEYIPERLTCASPTLPFNTKLLVKGVDGIVKIRVNDRGPFNVEPNGEVIYPLEPHPIRRLDLSKGSFLRVFGELDSGVREVRIVEVELP
jgi:hypothetical protein